jgi:hypothetical protein
MSNNTSQGICNSGGPCSGAGTIPIYKNNPAGATPGIQPYFTLAQMSPSCDPLWTSGVSGSTYPGGWTYSGTAGTLGCASGQVGSFTGADPAGVGTNLSGTPAGFPPGYLAGPSLQWQVQSGGPWVGNWVNSCAGGSGMALGNILCVAQNLTVTPAGCTAGVGTCTSTTASVMSAVEGACYGGIWTSLQYCRTVVDPTTIFRGANMQRQDTTKPPPVAIAVCDSANIQAALAAAGTQSTNPCVVVGGLGATLPISVPTVGQAPTPGVAPTTCANTDFVCQAVNTVWVKINALLQVMTELEAKVVALPGQIADAIMLKLGLQLPAKYQAQTYVDVGVAFQPVSVQGCAVFPFSIPCDVRDVLNAVTTTGTAPSWNLSLDTPMGPVPIVGDLGGVLDVACCGGYSPIQLIRSGELVVFTIGLALAVRNLMGVT